MVRTAPSDRVVPVSAAREFIGRRVAAAALALLAGCTASPSSQSQAVPPPGARPACQAGTDARGIAAGIFAFFQDRPECF